MNTNAQLAQDAFVELICTHGALFDELSTLLRGERLSEPQFNVLRILRGAGPEGLPCHEVGRRMVTRYPDVTRLIDRLVEAGLASRHRSDSDRRVVVIRLTRQAHGVLRRLDEPVTDLHARQLGHMTRNELTKLIALLEKARHRPPGDPR